MDWESLPSGILVRFGEFEGTFNDIFDKDIFDLGYNRYEIRPDFGLTDIEENEILFYFKLFSNELIAVHIWKYVDDADGYIKESLSGLWFNEEDEEELIRKGIEKKGISKAYVESLYGTCNGSDELCGGKYKFVFEEGWLKRCDSSDGISGRARQWLDVERYISEAKVWYGDDMSRIVREINLQADCFTSIDVDIVKSRQMRREFAYGSGCVNYIAMAAYFKTHDVDFSELVDSMHGDYKVIESNAVVKKIMAYGHIFMWISSLEATSDSDIAASGSGYIYVMINQSLPGMVKIGKTKRDPNERAKELSSATGVPTPFTLVYYRAVANCDLAELTLHNYLEEKGARVNNNREFFQITTTEAINLVNSLIDIMERDEKC